MASEGSGSGGGVVLHHLQDSRSQRILWLLEELETPYTIQKSATALSTSTSSHSSRTHTAPHPPYPAVL